MGRQPTPYVAYLVRFWSDRAGVESAWRVHLLDAHGEGRWGFATLDDLFCFLRAELSRRRQAQRGTGEDKDGY